MPKNDMNAMLKRRMSAAQQASELQVSDEAYQQIFQRAPPLAPTEICELPLDKLDPFFTADIGFKPYSPSKLKAFAEQLQEEGLLIRIIVRRIPGSDRYEILAGHNRTAAARLAGWTKIAAEVVVADDARATSIAILTNLLQRQDLSIIERGKAYKALLDAKNRQGYRSDLEEGTSGESRQKYSARALVAEFFAVTEYEIRKAIKLTQLIPELQYIIRKCPPPTADRQNIFAAWREARAEAERRLVAAPKKITFDRKRFAPYLDKLGGEKELESLFLEFLRERLG